MRTYIHVENGDVEFEGDLVTILRDFHFLVLDLSREIGIEVNDLLDIIKTAHNDVLTGSKSTLNILEKLSIIKGRN